MKVQRVIAFWKVFSILFLFTSYVHAGPALLFDAKNGNILYAEDEHDLWYPASLTKLMTAYIAFEEIKAGRLSFNDQLTSSVYANKQPPSKIGLPVGRQISLNLGLQALIVKSANDVAVMIAEKISGNVHAFAARMNETSKKLGMTRTKFYNPNGLPDGRQVTTARDMGLLAQALIKNFPEHKAFFKQIYVKIGKRKLRSHNDMLRKYAGADGMKTGFVCASGFNVVTSATRNNRRLVAVVLGSKTTALRRVRATKLLNYGFKIYDWKALYKQSAIGNIKEDKTDLRGPKNMRYRLTSTSCAGRRRVYKKKIKKKNKKAAIKKRKNKAKPRKVKKKN